MNFKIMHSSKMLDFCCILAIFLLTTSLFLCGFGKNVKKSPIELNKVRWSLFLIGFQAKLTDNASQAITLSQNQVANSTRKKPSQTSKREKRSHRSQELSINPQSTQNLSTMFVFTQPFYFFRRRSKSWSEGVKPLGSTQKKAKKSVRKSVTFYLD